MKYLYPNAPNWLDPESAKQFDKKTDWIAERKKNGWRCLAIRTEIGLELWTRRHTIIHDALPITRNALILLPPNTIIDGELIDKRSKDIKDHYYAFDILFLEGKQLTGLTWTIRRRLLEEVMRNIPVEISEPIIPGKFLQYETAVKEGDEGIVMKWVNSKYLVDYGNTPKNPHWLKCKKPENAFKLEG